MLGKPPVFLSHAGAMCPSSQTLPVGSSTLSSALAGLIKAGMGVYDATPRNSICAAEHIGIADRVCSLEVGMALTLYHQWIPVCT